MAKAAIALLAALSGLAGSELEGQSAADTPAAFCWKGQALPVCRSFAIFELEVGLAVSSTSVVHEGSGITTQYPVFGNELKWHLGGLRNLSEDLALGATLSLGSGSPTPLTGIRLRARRWFEPPMSIELEAGVVDTGINDRFGSGFGWGPTLGARLNAGDHASLFTRWEGAYAEAGSDGLGFQRDAGFHHGIYVGASAGSTVAAVGTAVLVGMALAMAYALSQGDF